MILGEQLIKILMCAPHLDPEPIHLSCPIGHLRTRDSRMQIIRLRRSAARVRLLGHLSVSDRRHAGVPSMHTPRPVSGLVGTRLRICAGY